METAASVLEAPSRKVDSEGFARLSFLHMNSIGPHRLVRLLKPVMLGGFLAASPVFGQTAVPGQTTRPSAAPPTNEMASSRFAPDSGTIRELQMIGEAAPPPPGPSRRHGPPAGRVTRH